MVPHSSNNSFSKANRRLAPRIRPRRLGIWLAGCLSFCAVALPLHGIVLRYEQSPGTTTGWVTAMNLPDDLPEIRGLVIVGNGVGADETGSVNNAELVALARSHGFGVMGLGRWSNLYSTTERSRFLAALSDFAVRANRPELVNVPWVAFGFSQGGGQAYSLNYHFPSRTIAIGVNKGGYSYLNGGSDTGRLDQTGIGGRAASPNAQKTPALLVAGSLDESGRITNATNAFTNNRAQGAPWAMLVEDGVGHEKGRAYHWILPFLAEAITLRYPSNQSPASGQPTLTDVDQTTGWLIDQSTQSTGFLQVQSQSGFGGTSNQRLPLGWVPGEATARRAQAFGSYSKITSLTANSTTTTPSAAPLDLVYGVDLSTQTSPAWTKVEFFDGSTFALGELLSAAGSTPAWVRRLTTTSGFVSTYGLVTRADSSQRFTQLQTVWMNGGAGFTLPTGSSQLVWSSNSTGSWTTAANWTGNAVPSFGADSWVGLSNTASAAIQANLDGARSIGYLQNVTGNYIVVNGGTGGSLAFATTGGRSAAIQLGAGGTFEFKFAPTGSAPLELIGNGNPGGPASLIMSAASSYSGAITVRNNLRWDMAVSSTAFGTTGNGTSIASGSVLNFREWPSGSITVPEPFTLAGLGQPGLPALRVGTANNSTVTLTGALTLNGPVALGAASSANGIAFTLNGTITSQSASDRSLYLGYLQSQAGDGTLPGGTSLNTTGLDDSGGIWGATTFGSNVSYPGLAPDRVVMGLGDFRLVGAANRLPTGARLVLNTAAATATTALRQSKLTLVGVSQELAGLESYAGNNTGYTAAVVGGASTVAALVVNTPTLANSTFAGSLGGVGANENNFTLEKRGAGTLTLTGSLSYSGATKVTGGSLVIGSGVGSLDTNALTVDAGATLSDAGALALPGSTIIRRSASDGSAAIQVAGTLNLSGILTVELPGYTPVVGAVTPLLGAGAVTGSFAEIRIPRTSTGPTYAVEITGTAVQLHVVETNVATALYRAGLLGATTPVTSSLLNSDTDGDGLPNLIEYALGTPLNSPIGSIPQLQPSLRFSFQRDTRLQDVILIVEATSNLTGSWGEVARFTPSSGWSGPVTESSPDANGIAAVTVNDPLAAPPRFYRLRAQF